MHDTVVLKLKKYLLYISIFLSTALGTHLAYLYIYEGSQSEAQVGGTVSEAIIGTFPHLNPLVPSNDHNAYMNGLLYRSLLQYSTTSENLEADLASCNIENLLYVECVLENNLRWSDDSPITPEDIAATLILIRETKVNPILASLLEKTEIEVGENSIILRNPSKDINFLQVLLQPILPKKVVEKLTEESVDGKFSETGGIYSGRFTLTSISQDETVGITKITLGKNEKYAGNTLYIQFLILNLFRDEAHFLKNKNSFQIFNDKDGLIGDSVPRLDSFEYYISQFVGNFLNTETLSQDMRKYIIENTSREKILSEIGEKKIFSAVNPFLSDINIDVKNDDFQIDAFMKEKGFYRKKDLLKSVLAIEDAEKEEKKVISPEVSVLPIQEVIQQESLKYIVSPSTQKYNFISEDNVLVEGKVDPEVSAVYINDYKLSGYNPGDTVFYYRLLESYDSLKIGENRYTLSFEVSGKKQKIEEFVYIYETDVAKLDEIQKGFFTPETQKVPIISSPVKEVVVLPRIKTSLTAEDIQVLDEDLFYDATGKLFEMQLLYTLGDTAVETTAKSIQSQLKNAGISVIITPSTLADISIGLRNESLKYDMLLLGINLGYFGSNIFPYFHSSQVKNGYNFSNFKKLSLDILLEELTSHKLPLTKQKELEAKMLDILKEESIIQVFYTPKIQLLVDKNIKDFKLPAYLPDGKHRFYPLIPSYLSEKKTLVLENKGFFDFFLYLIKIMFS